MEKLAVKETPINKLIQSMKEKTLKLSYSSFKEFAKSPRHFLKYKLSDRKETDAMKMGTLLDCLVTEPEEFENRYVVSSMSKPSGKGGVLIDAMLDGVSVEDAILIAGYQKKPGANILTNCIDFVDFQKANSSKVIISESEYESQRIKKEALYNNSSSRFLLDRAGATQLPVKWKNGGWDWRGIIDLKGDNFICDLKSVADANPKKLRYTVRDMRYDWQAAMYSGAINRDLNYFIMAVDSGCNVTVMDIGRGARNIAQQDINYYVNKFNQCVFLDRWNTSYDFYASNGVYDYSMI